MSALGKNRNYSGAKHMDIRRQTYTLFAMCDNIVVQFSSSTTFYMGYSIWHANEGKLCTLICKLHNTDVQYI